MLGLEHTVSTASIVVAAKDQISSELVGEAVILNLKTGVYYGLDPIGALIWSLIQQPASVSNIRDAILSEYEVEPDRCEHDLLALLAELKDKDLIETQ